MAPQPDNLSVACCQLSTTVYCQLAQIWWIVIKGASVICIIYHCISQSYYLISSSTVHVFYCTCVFLLILTKSTSLLFTIVASNISELDPCKVNRPPLTLTHDPHSTKFLFATHACSRIDTRKNDQRSYIYTIMHHQHTIHQPPITDDPLHSLSFHKPCPIFHLLPLSSPSTR